MADIPDYSSPMSGPFWWKDWRAVYAKIVQSRNALQKETVERELDSLLWKELYMKTKDSVEFFQNDD